MLCVVFAVSWLHRPTISYCFLKLPRIFGAPNPAGFVFVTSAHGGKGCANSPFCSSKLIGFKLGREPNPSKPIKGKRAGPVFLNSLKKGTHKKGGESRVFSQGTAANMSWAAAKKDPFL
jgi:hypothetical protein